LDNVGRITQAEIPQNYREGNRSKEALMSETLAELRGLPDDEIIKRHDRIATSTTVSVCYYLEELARRDQDSHTRVMLRYTKWIMLMTVIMTISTVVNVIIVTRIFCR